MGRNSLEEWRHIKGYENYYQVSNLGRVRSLDRTIINTNGIESNLKGRLMSLADHPRGYKIVTLRKNGKRRTVTVHRLVAEAFLINVLKKCEVNHKDGVKSNNHATNLEWSTSSENSIHAFKNGLRKAKAKLTKEQVKEIRLKYGSGVFKQKELGMLYGVDYRTIGGIVRREIWKDLEE